MNKPLNQTIVELAVYNANKFIPDTSLLDAIVEMDKKTVCYLVNNRYKLEVINRGFTQEPVVVNKLIEILESYLNLKHINVAV